MKKLLSTLIIIFALTNASYSEIVFRIVCDEPTGQRVDKRLRKMDNTVIHNGFESDRFSGDDKIEFIYDSSTPDYIQRIWGTDNEKIKLLAHNDDFFHWIVFDKNYANGFYWNQWNISIPDMFLIFQKGNSHNDGLGSGIANSVWYSHCERIN